MRQVNSNVQNVLTHVLGRVMLGRLEQVDQETNEEVDTLTWASMRGRIQEVSSRVKQNMEI